MIKGYSKQHNMCYANQNAENGDCQKVLIWTIADELFD